MKNYPENNTDKYIAGAPEEMRVLLKELRAIIQNAIPNATERTDYFQMPGYSSNEFDYYNGMFVWFSYNKTFARLHLLPVVIENHNKELKGYRLSKSIIGFKTDEKIPKILIKKLIKECKNAMPTRSKIIKK